MKKKCFIIIAVFLSVFISIFTITGSRVKVHADTSQTWIIKENPVLTSLSATINFVTISNTINYVEFIIVTRGGGEIHYDYGDSYNIVYRSSSGWDSQNNRTLIFETAPTGALLTWLQANADLQGSEPDDPTYEDGYEAGIQYVLDNLSEYNLFTQQQYNANYNAGVQQVINNPTSYNLYNNSEVDSIKEEFYQRGKNVGHQEVIADPHEYNLYSAAEYDVSYSAGLAYGQEAGYQTGYIAGSSEHNMLDVVSDVFEAPFQVLLGSIDRDPESDTYGQRLPDGLLSFELFGINLSAVFQGLMTCSIVIFILKLIF